MTVAWSAVVFALGFFALVAQALLFRSFLGAFEGNELGVGSFFSSWLLWVALGALLGRLAFRGTAAPRLRFAALTLLYIPAFVLQDVLLANSRSLIGVASYEIFPLHALVGLSLATNAPISLLTGFLFTLACRCARESRGLPVARVYVLESLGGFTGGIAVTLLLSLGVEGVTVFIMAALVLALAVALFFWSVKSSSRHWRILVAIVPVALVATLVAGLDRQWASAGHRAMWERLLPTAAYRGSFSTAQGTYLHGEREGQFMVLSWGGVSEALPGTEHASEVAALTLAQRPTARRCMIVGPGSLPLCLRLTTLPQIDTVTWLHTDPEYPRALLEVMPEQYRHAANTLEIPALDVRSFIQQGQPRYDLIILNLPEVTSLVLNRYSTLEFYRQLKRVLVSDGILAVRLDGAANYLGGELAYLGSSALITLESAMKYVVLKPGDESWLIASDSDLLSESPAILRDRLASIDGVADFYPPAGLLSLYLPDRIEFQLDLYNQVSEEVGTDFLLNTDQRPKALLYSLAVGWRRAGVSISRMLPLILKGAAWVAASIILLYVLLRLVFVVTSPRAPVSAPAPWRRHSFDGAFMVFSTGIAGMATSIVIMFLYQARHGSLYLHLGVVSSLFMLGLFLGGLVVERLLTRWGREPVALVPVVVALFLGVLLSVSLVPAETPRSWFAVLFSLAGMVTGACFSVGAQRLKDAGVGVPVAGATLETIDHLGGALGALLTGLLLLPLLGAAVTVILLALLVTANLLALLGVRERPFHADLAVRVSLPRVRPVAYVVFGVVATLLIASNITASLVAGSEGQRLESAARELAGGADLRVESATLAAGAPVVYYSVLDETGAVTGSIFNSGAFTETVTGYGGPIVLAIHIDREGGLQGFRLLRSRETPAYLELLEGWRRGLAGRKILVAGDLEAVDACSGATMSSQAILRALEESGRGFARDILGHQVAGPTAPTRSWWPDRNFVCLAMLTIAAVILRFVNRVWVRRLFLVTSIVVAGLWLNLQYSTQHVCALLGLQAPGVVLTGSFFMVVVLPVVVALIGNVYCGYVCPFGALQELLGDLRPRRFETDPGVDVWRYGRAIKYLLLALVVALFALSRRGEVLAADPLSAFFGGVAGGIVIAMAITALVLSLVFRRFWCRNLCPAGAFLALLNRVKLLRRITPKTIPGKCDMGVRTSFELDCLCCDRCRHEKK